MSITITPDRDIMAFANEPSMTPRPKDLRDEFAMVAMGAMLSASFSAQLHNSAQTPDNDYLSMWSYDIADAMMKARERKV